MVDAPVDMTSVLKGLGYGPDWALTPGTTGAMFGFSVAGAGDVNCDGYDDVIIGGPGYNGGFDSEGIVVVCYGSPTGPAMGSVSWSMTGRQEGAELGFSVAGAGDVNQDDCSDVIVGAPGLTYSSSGEGGAWVFHGAEEGLHVEPDNFDFGNQESASFGWAVGCAGDVDDDGYDDVFVTAPFYDNPFANEGMVWVWHGSGSGISSIHNWRAEGNQHLAWFGSSAAGVGDVNDDGYDDLLVGAMYYNNGESQEGMAFVWHGSEDGLNNDVNGTPANAAWSRDSNQEGAGFGYSVSGAGDVNGDGYDDAIIGAPYFDAGQEEEGAAWLYLGSDDGLGTYSVNRDEGNKVGAWFGLSVAGAGDVENDGRDDVIVGAPYLDTDDLNNVGKVWAWHGAPSGISSLSDWSYEGVIANAQVGWSVASAGDVNGDGYDDIIVGAPWFGGSGVAMIFFGRDQWIFYDDFETGSTSFWSSTVP